MRSRKRFAVLSCLMILFLQSGHAQEVTQMDIPYMRDWPTLPTPYVTRDWNETAKKVTLLALDGTADYPYFPVSTYFQQETPLSGGFQGENFGTHTYLQSDNTMRGYGEAVAQLASILTASLTEGLDARHMNGKDYVAMAQAYFSRTPDGRGFVSNNTPADDCAPSYWYTLYPTLLYFHLAAQYPQDETLTGHIRAVADTWLEAAGYIHDWDSLGVSLKEKRIITGGHTEPEGMIGAAYVLLMAHARLGEEKYLAGALSLMLQAAERPSSPYYEILGSYAPYIAARLNAEQNAGLPLARMLDWVFTDGMDSARGGWGVIRSAWGGYDAYGLSGSLSDTAGYAFAMNTFVTAGALAPVARYAPQYSRALGQYLTAVASNSHMFFGDGLPAALQDDGAYAAQTGLGYLVYEGVRNRGVTTPFATGDAKGSDGKGTNFSFYSSGPIGLFSSLVHPTNVPEILCFDLLKTDFEHRQAYPTFLLYNPLSERKQVTLTLPKGAPVDVYDAVSGAYLAKAAQGQAQFAMEPDTAVQAVLIPAGLSIQEGDGCLTAGGVPVRFGDAWTSLPEIREGQMIREAMTVRPALYLPEGDRAVDCRLTYRGKTLLQTAGLPQEIRLDPAALGAGRGALQWTVVTESGRALSWAQGIKVFPAGGRILLRLDAGALYTALKRTDNCSLTQVEKGLQMELSYGWAYFNCPKVRLRAQDQPLLMVDVPYAWGGWGLFALIDGRQHYIQGDCAGEGQFLYDLGALMRQWGVEEAEVTLQPFITTGKGAKVIIHEITIWGGAD